MAALIEAEEKARRAQAKKAAKKAPKVRAPTSPLPAPAAAAAAAAAGEEGLEDKHSAAADGEPSSRHAAGETNGLGGNEGSTAADGELLAKATADLVSGSPAHPALHALHQEHCTLQE